jgi:hypothetical protein
MEKFRSNAKEIVTKARLIRHCAPAMSELRIHPTRYPATATYIYRVYKLIR